jgi:hypothetical protein
MASRARSHTYISGIGIPLSGFLHQVGKDAPHMAASVAQELRHYVK